ncbi:MAG: regulatory protein GemA [Helicobacter sp.]|nr:regulatory protein GemA [Helicobacter sp.]
MQKLSPLQENERKRLIAGIHIKKQELGMAEIQYRDLLWERYKVESSKELNLKELRELAEFLGFFPKKAIQKANEVGGATDAQIQTIIKTYNSVAEDKSELGLRKFIKRIVGRMPLYLDSLSLQEAQKVIVGLKKWQENKKG